LANFDEPRACFNYALRATLEPPTFLRHGQENEEPLLATGATVTFKNVRLEPST
jgi:hypothetical protein